MKYICRYDTPEGFSDLLMGSDGEYLTALHFERPGDTGTPDGESRERVIPVFAETARWLDIYFGGEDPGFLPKMKFGDMSAFRTAVLERMLRIPYGESVTYGDIAGEISPAMSARAVGGAVGRNPICIIVPCHRMLGAKGKITGYGGGLENKRALLKLEGIDFRK